MSKPNAEMEETSRRRDSLLGGISVCMGISMGCSTALLVGVVSTFFISGGRGEVFGSYLLILIISSSPFLLVFIPLSALIGLTLGLIGLLQEGNNLGFPILGISLNAFPLVTAMIGYALLSRVIF